MIAGLCLFVFFNISSFTIITSFTKSNFLTAIQTSSAIKEVYNQKPYFFLYGFSGVCFILFYLLYNALSPRASFEYRIKRDILSMIGCSAVLYLIPTISPGFQQRFFPAAVYFVVYDVLDDLIIVQTWTLINYSIDIRESKRIQNLFLFSGGVAAFIAGQFIIGLVPKINQTFFLLLVILFSGISYLIVTYVFSFHRSRILATISAERVGLKTLLSSQRKYRVIKSIIAITVLIGVFNLFFKVLFDTQINARYPAHQAGADYAMPVDEGGDRPDPKTEFIGKYKAFTSLFQVVMQLLFVYFFVKLWLNGKILLSYPLLLIPSLAFMLLAYFTRRLGYENFLFWGTVFACGINDLIRRVIFDSAYQLLMFSIPERLCNALRMYSKLFIKPIVIIVICLFFLIIPAQESPIPLYCILLMALLIVMIAVISQIPGNYVSSLKTSVLRRVPVERILDSLVSLESSYIVEQYQKVVEGSNDRFGYLYILNIIRDNYSSDLNFILTNLLQDKDKDVCLEAILVVGELGIDKLLDQIELLFDQKADPEIQEACLRVMVERGTSDSKIIEKWMELDLAPRFRRYVLAIAFRNGPEELKERVIQEATSLTGSSEDEEVLAGIWLVGELGLSDLKNGVKRCFGMDDPRAYGVILGAIAKLMDFELFKIYLGHIGYGQIRDYDTFNEHLALFGTRSYEVISDMLNHIIRTKSNFELKKCIQALQFAPSQDAIDFLGNILSEYNVPAIREEALRCIAKMEASDPQLDYSAFLDRLPEEINRCKEYCRYYNVMMSSNPDSLLLIELTRNIEHRVWGIFKVLDTFYPDLAVLDSYYRITHTSSEQVISAHVKARSIEYLESLIQQQHAGLLQILESIQFDGGFLSGVAPLPGPTLSVEDVYEQILTHHSNHWLEISIILDMPPDKRREFESVFEEIEDMIPVLEKIHFLKRVPIFKGFSINEMVIIAQITREVRFEAGHVLFKRGDLGDALYLILEGEVHIVNEKGDLLIDLKPPKSFGEVALLDKKGRTATAVCVQDCRMLMISNNDFQEILEKYPILYKNIVFILTSWLREDKTRASGQG